MVSTETKGKLQQAILLKSSYTEVLYGIWIERNLKIFEKKRSHTWERVEKEIVYVICVRASPLSPNPYPPTKKNAAHYSNASVLNVALVALGRLVLIFS